MPSQPSTTELTDTVTRHEVIDLREARSARDRREADPAPRRMSDAFGPFHARHRLVLAIVLYVATAIGAWSVRFVQDDAFISFRYARNLAEGRGLVFNPGERVEGYTNFLWTVLMAIPERLGWSTPLFSQIVGIGCALATVAIAKWLAAKVLGDGARAYLAAVVLVTNMTFLSYATGGLETMLQTLLVTAMVGLLLPFDVERLAGLRARQAAAGLVGGLALLTRLDSAVLLAVASVVHLFALRRISLRPVRAVVTSAIVIGSPLLAVVTPWLIWKEHYYGTTFPNTLTAKTGAFFWWPLLYGLLYVVVFLLSFGLPLLAPRLRGVWRESTPRLRQIAWVIPVWLGYIVLVGADFMEFRFVVPILPVIAIVEFVALDTFTAVRKQVLLVGALAVASIGHVVLPSLGYPVSTFHDLDIWPATTPYSQWSVGRDLAATFPGGLDEPNQVRMAIGSLGIWSYESQLPTVDLLGLTDPVVARRGEALNVYYPGHLRLAPLDYLVERSVNLVAMVRVIERRDPDRRTYRLSEVTKLYPVVDLGELPPTARVVEIPIANDDVWMAIYLTPHPAVDRAIATRGWRVFPIERVCRASDIPFLVRLVGTRTCA